MFRTEVVKSRNLRKTLFFKIYNGIAILILVFILATMLKLFGTESSIQKFIEANYTSIIQPVIMGVAFLLIIASMYTRNAVKNPNRLGSVEIDENELRYLIDDEVQETISWNNITSVDFEFFSFRMRGNPMGCMNYLSIHTKDEGDKNYEIVIANSLVKAEFGSLLNEINKKVPVKVTYAYFLKKLLGDSDFKFE